MTYTGKESKKERVDVYVWASQGAPVVQNLSANAGDIRDVGSSPGSGRPSGGWNGNPLQYSCLENPMDREGRGGYSP